MRVGKASMVAGDAGSLGAVVGLVVSVVLAAVLMGLSFLSDRGERASERMGCSCLLKLAALLTLTLGLGAGYMIARAVGG